MGVALRGRRPQDLPSLLVVLQRTHDLEGYPVRAAAVSDWWLASPEELGGWVALDGSRVVGHAALHPAGGAAVPLWCAGSGREPADLAVVSRLFTDRTVRGAGTALLGHAADAARRAGRLPVLEVDLLSPALPFYRRRGWRDVGTVAQQWGHRTVDSVALIAPSSGCEGTLDVRGGAEGGAR